MRAFGALLTWQVEALQSGTYLVAMGPDPLSSSSGSRHSERSCLRPSEWEIDEELPERLATGMPTRIVSATVANAINPPLACRGPSWVDVPRHVADRGVAAPAPLDDLGLELLRGEAP